MVILYRFMRILQVLIRYRLDQLLPANRLPWPVRLLLMPLRYLAEPNLSRGERIRKTCEDLGPVFIKFGQQLSTRPDLIPADIAAELDHLQDNVPPFDAAVFRQIVEKSLGKNIDSLFVCFDDNPLASASVAQVHTAIIHNGQEVVVKVIRPGIRDTIEQDMQLLILLARLVERYTLDGKRLRPVEVVEDYRQTILDELDLQREAANASQLRRNFSQSPLLYVPEVYWDYTREDVMVMERIYGVQVTDIAALEAQNTNVKLLAERGVELFFTQVFKYNFFHADMHPGNIFVSREHPQRPQYMAVDMAIVGSLTQEDQYYLARNLIAIFRRDYRLVAQLHVQCGWVPSDTPINEFEGAIRKVCEPIFEKPLKEISFGQVLIQLFRTARRFNMQVQPQLVLLQKTLLNIEGLGRQLYPDLDLWSTAHPYLEKWLEERFHPKSLWYQLKRYAPEWMEKFPQIPHMVFNTLEQLSTQPASPYRAAPATAPQKHRPRSSSLAYALLALAALTAYPAFSQTISEIPTPSLVLAAIAATILLMR